MRGFSKHKNSMSRTSIKSVIGTWLRLMQGYKYNYEQEKTRRRRQIERGIIPASMIMHEEAE